MKKRTSILITLVTLVTIITNSNLIFAQGSDDQLKSTSLPCFELYPYGALRIIPELDKNYYKPGEIALLKLKVTNEHDLTSLYNAKVILQIRKYLSESNTSLLLSENLVLGENLQYLAKTTTENSFQFLIPNYLPEGEYQGYIYITEGNYSISGLLFTQDVTGAVVGFSVKDSDKKVFDFPYFREEHAKINEKISANPFYPPPLISFDELPAKLTLPIFNPSGVKRIVSLKMELYYWDENEKIITSQSQKIHLEGKETKTISFSVPQGLKAGTYMLKSTLRDGEYVNISKIRFSLPGFAPRIFFSGVQGREFFVCVGNSTFEEVERESEIPEERTFKLTMEVYDELKKEKIGELVEMNVSLRKDSPTLLKGSLSRLSPNIHLKTQIAKPNGEMYDLDERSIELRSTEASFLARKVEIVKIFLFLLILIFLISGIILMIKGKIIIGGLIIILALLSLIMIWLFILRRPLWVAAERGTQNLYSNWSGEIARKRVQIGWWDFYYADLSLDFNIQEVYGDIEPEEKEREIYLKKANVGESFLIKEINYGSYYTLYRSYDSPFFRFKDKLIPDLPIPDEVTGTHTGFIYHDNLKFLKISREGGELKCKSVTYDVWQCEIKKLEGNSPKFTFSLEREVKFPKNIARLSKTKVIVFPNQPPIVDAGPDRIVNSKEQTTLGGSGYDPDGGRVTFKWQCTKGEVVDPENPQATFIAPSVEEETHSICTLTATDERGVSASSSVKITIKPIEIPIEIKPNGDKPMVTSPSPEPLPKNQPPIAKINCDPSRCLTMNCTAFQGCLFQLVNNSTDPDGQSDIIKSEWDIIDWGIKPDLKCSGICHFTPQTLMMAPGAYKVTLLVQDKEGAISTDTVEFRVLREVKAGFMCSLDNKNWRKCTELSTLYRDSLIYFKDDPSLPEHSVPSENANSIVKRIWKINGTVFSEDNNPNPSVTLTKSKNTVELIVTDDRGRSNSIIYEFLTLAYPYWSE